MKTYQLVFLALALCVTSAFAQNGPQQRPQITISGAADVKVAPDQVNIRLGVESRNDNLNEATRINDERMRSALQFLKSAGVPNKNIQTDFINVMPEYNNNSWAKPVVYIVRKSIEINLTNVAKFETIMTGLLTNGINNVQGIEFRTSQLRKYRDEARAKAIQAAREKADTLCAELGVKRGRPLNINANEWGSVWNPYGSWWGNQGYGFASNAQVVAQNAGGAPDESGETVALGQISVSATVNVSFAIE